MTEDAVQPRRVIYIAGYGHSGSTLLGRLMAQNDHVLDLGEICSVTRHFVNRNRRCTCGSVVTECPVWSRVPTGPVSQRKRHADAATHRALLEAAAEVGDRGICVDSSKTAGSLALRPFSLDRNAATQLTLVHVVRDPRAVVWSMLRRRLRHKRPSPGWLRFVLAARISAGWIVANCGAGLFRLCHPRRSVLICYERLIREGAPDSMHELIPAGPLEGRRLEPRPANHHAIAGNRMRNQDSVVVVLDRDWQESLSPALAAFVVFLCLPFMLRYGFLGRGVHDAAPTSCDKMRRNVSRKQ